MRSIKVALATAAVVGATVSGAYAAGVLNKVGHEVNAHAAHGQSVAAAARAKRTSEPTQTPSATDPTESDEPTATDPTESDDPTAPTTEDPADDQGENADDQGENADDQGEEPSAPTAPGTHLGQTKPHQHYGHAWGKGHGSGQPNHLKPSHPAHPVHPTHPAHPTHPTHPEHPAQPTED